MLKPLFLLPLLISFTLYSSGKTQNDSKGISGLVVTAYTHRILVVWDDVRAADKYELRYSTNHNMSDAIHKISTYVHYVITDLQKETNYYIQVRVMYHSKWSKWSEIADCKTALFSTTVETYNILSSKYDYVFPNNVWNERKGAMRDIIMQTNNIPDILAIQEGMVKSQVQDLSFLLKNTYDSHISVRDISPRAIFWKREKYSLISFDGNIEVLDSNITGYASTRYVTCVKLKEKTTNKELLIFDVHAPASFRTDNQKIRAGLATILSHKAKKMAKTLGDVPVIVMGDFNSLPKSTDGKSPTPAMILKKGGFIDTYNATSNKTNAYYGTHNRITTGVATSGQNGKNCSKRIDYIFTYPANSSTVSDYHIYINFESNSSTVLKRPIPSDHRPVRVTLHFHY